MLRAHRERHRRVVMMAGFQNRQSYLFDGVNERININAVRTALATTTTGTWSFWVKPVDATPAASEILCSFGNGNETDLIQFINLAGGGNGNTGCSLFNNAISQWRLNFDVSPLNDNIWTHLAIVQDGVSPALYVNGIAPAQTFSTSTNTTVWFNGLVMNNGRIGCRFWSVAEGDGGLPFNGNIDQGRFWNRALSAAEILDDYNNGRPKRPNTNGLVSSFPFDGDPFDGTNFSVRDHQSNNHGATVNMEYADLELDVF